MRGEEREKGGGEGVVGEYGSSLPRPCIQPVPIGHRLGAGEQEQQQQQQQQLQEQPVNDNNEVHMQRDVDIFRNRLASCRSDNSGDEDVFQSSESQPGDASGNEDYN